MTLFQQDRNSSAGHRTSKHVYTFSARDLIELFDTDRCFDSLHATESSNAQFQLASIWCNFAHCDIISSNRVERSAF